MNDIFNLGDMIFKSELLSQERERRRIEIEENKKIKNSISRKERLLLSKRKRIETLKSKLFCVYILMYKGVPYYVGASSNISKRIKDHLKSKDKSPHYKLYKFMNDNNINEIDYYIIDENISYDDIEFWETYYINLYRSYGFKLMNVSNIGGGGITR